MIGIITATAQECEALSQIMSTRISGTMNYVQGKLAGCEVTAVRAGVAKVNAAMCAQKMIDLYHPEGIINIGVAGALNPALRQGDIVVSRDAVEYDVDSTYFGELPGQVSGLPVAFPADKTLQEKALQAASKLGYKAVSGRVLSGEQFVSSAERKHEIAEKFDGDCVEMEGAAIAQVCYVSKVPFVIIRAISDGAGDEAGMQYDEFVVKAAEKAARLLAAIMEEKS